MPLANTLWWLWKEPFLYEKVDIGLQEKLWLWKEPQKAIQVFGMSLGVCSYQWYLTKYVMSACDEMQS